MPSSNIPFSGFGVPRNIPSTGVSAQTPFMPGILSVEKIKPALAPLRRRMGLAYDKLVVEAEQRENALSPKTIRTLGKLVLEFEQVNTNLAAIQAQIRQDIRDKKKYFDEEKKLYKKEEDNLSSLRFAFLETRGKIAAVSALLAGKALMEGRFGDAAIDASVAVGAMLPEIVNIASTLVLGRLALGGMGRAAAGTAIRGGGMAIPGIARTVGLVGLGAAVPLTMGAADVRREDTLRRQRYSTNITPQDVQRFQATVSRFDAILSRSSGAEIKQPEAKSAEEDIKELQKPKPEKYPGGGGNRMGNVNAGDIIADTPQEKAAIATIREVEGTAGKQGYNTFFGGSLYGGDLSKLTVNQVVELQKKFLREGRGDYPGGRSAAVGAGQFMTPETVVGAMGMDPNKEKFTPELQNKMILFLARRVRGVDVSKPLTVKELRILNNEWAGIGPRYGQTRRTLEETEQIYQQNLREAQGAQTSPKPRKSAQESGIYGRYGAQSSTGMPASSDISLVTIPGKQSVAKPVGPKSAPASSEVAFNTEFESFDKFTSRTLLGVFG